MKLLNSKKGQGDIPWWLIAMIIATVVILLGIVFSSSINFCDLSGGFLC
ncbi:MAG TPA: hypothetical protein VEC16_02730 [Alphaproteobacteria bacterium]|nr:hypothetical protein [Alphaproteobacteria bacterium]